jgi:uncharacterized protein (TIGR00297 family)
LLLSAGAGYLAHRRGALTRSGVFGAVLTGTAVVGFGGWVRGLLLIAFFVSSSVLSRYKDAAKAGLAEKFAKGSRRDLGQTLANGGLAALLCVPIGWLAVAEPGGSEASAYPVLALGFYGALATVTADTWATELGVLARSRPRLITTGRHVAVGASGGVTLQGTLAALAGAAFIGVVGFVLIQGAALATLGRWLLQDWIVIPIAAVSGLLGALFDSVLGATVQAMYRCDACRVETERTVHTCGRPARPLRGWHWLSNDWVNFIASGFGAGVAALLAVIIL